MYKVAIRKNETGEIRIREWPYSDWNAGQMFYWTEGNMSCDCNRGVQFMRAGGEEMEAEAHLDAEWQCDDNRYSVLYAELEDGTRIQIDDEDVLPQSNES